MTQLRQNSPFDVLIIGAGFAGMYMLHKTRELGLRAVVIEAAGEVGGIWYSTRYPGLRCDIESMQYSYSFNEQIQQEWNWSDRFAKGEEIARYAAFVADKLDLRRDIVFNTRVSAAHWHEAGGQWEVRTDSGEAARARFLIMATGTLARPVVPDIAGIHDFAGKMCHTSAWPAAVSEFSGQRVGVIGTGSSGVQVAVEAAKTAQSLHIFQRTIPFVVELGNSSLDAATVAEIKRDYRGYRRRAFAEGGGMVLDFIQRRSIDDFSGEELEAEMERCWQLGHVYMSANFTDVTTNRAGNDKISDFIRRKIRSIVTDPAKAATVMPSTRYGGKRLVQALNYYQMFNKPNIHGVDLKKTPIVRVHPDGIETTEERIGLDMLILATGYDAATGPMKYMDLIGKDGADLNRLWADAPMTYLGLMSAGFPNMFLITGPGSPAVLSNVIFSIERHVEWIGDCLSYLRAHSLRRIEAGLAAQQAWFKHVNELAATTILWEVDNWYNGQNIKGKPKNFLFYVGGVPNYQMRLHQVVSDGYRGFHLT
jgi:cation diffusion facilitator CzcD-associated flavoprotein CzcO